MRHAWSGHDDGLFEAVELGPLCSTNQWQQTYVSTLVEGMGNVTRDVDHLDIPHMAKAAGPSH